MESYCQIADVNTQATLQSEANWTALTDAQKTDLVFLGTRDIEEAHGQPRDNDTPWGFGKTELYYICIEQSLYLSRVFDMKRLAERIAAATQGEYKDNVLTMTAGSGVGLTMTANIMLKDFMNKSGLSSGAQFKRG